MSLSRRLLLALAAAARRAAPARAADAGSAPALIERFYDELLAVMKEAKRLVVRRALQPARAGHFADLRPAADDPLAIGPGWAQIAAEQQQRLTAAFSRYTISVYANRFDDFGGERFEVPPSAAANPNGVLVSSRLVKTNGEAVALNYLMRQERRRLEGHRHRISAARSASWRRGARNSPRSCSATAPTALCS